MNNNNYNAFSDNQDLETTELTQEEHNLIPLPLLMPQKLDANQHLQNRENEIVSTVVYSKPAKNTEEDIIAAINLNQVWVTRHAKEEAANDHLFIDEINFSATQGQIIEDYPNDTPYPSCLIYGLNQKGDPIHSVWAYNKDTGLAVLITVYCPDPNKWINGRIRKKD
ncbi:DUF4258 domain-containing protein [Anabaena cylindrica UHCC 0172]|uniref:DUF4258 domain-containing protein n=1 Tax=Anabaena cylindrica TaxID=1165 RepID=UPI002B1FB771|nr:DUF4258 domain-containing protein [Anabaena cylindrica]MEA5550790.1 DUF4258 domain-containing protein [Anabaena cylindrica UHCC 0172]